MTITTAVQGSFDELLAAEPLRGVTFVVVDLETTGATSSSDAITEIGAVKVRGGEVLGEFATLINPQTSISPFISRLTGITNAMVAQAPSIAATLPSFLEFAHGAVLVAHNAPFDLGFLRAASERHGLEWPRFRTVDTVALARKVVPRGEVPNHKLATLAQLFRAATPPTHRALDDARATVDVLHGLLARLGSFGVETLAELIAFNHRVSPEQRRKRHLADDLPTGPGVYIFRAADDRPLYVGTSRNVRARVRHYFASSEKRSRMGEMVALAERVEVVECAHPLEAQVCELRLIAAHKPPYNRRSKYPERHWWLTLTEEAYPRLSLVPRLRENRSFLGPFPSRSSAESAVTAIYEALPLRQCTKKLSVRKPSSACALAELDKCGAPCLHRESPAQYANHVDELIAALTLDPAPMIARLTERIDRLAAQQRYEDAAALRDRLAVFLRTLLRMHRLGSITRVNELVAACRVEAGVWELAVIRRGRLVAAATTPDVHAVLPVTKTLKLTAETVAPSFGPLPCASAEETERIHAWLEQPGIRIVSADGAWTCHAAGFPRWQTLLGQLTEARVSAASYDAK